ncbi:GTP cyclohydrolase I, partial [Trifolium medium]|nr:GTP cyclohydrolase I [Trifolium medium]
VKCHVGYVPSGERVVGLSKLSRVADVFAKRHSNHQGLVKILVSSGSGVFENKNADEWADFFSLLKFRDISMEKIHFRGSSDSSWCPSQSAKVSSKIGTVNPAMVTAVASI